MKKFIIFLFLIILSVSAFSNGKVNVPLMTTAPTIDGVVDETEWQEAVGINNFIVFTATKKAPYETKVYMGYKDGKIYIAYKCYGEERPIAKNTDRDHGAFWEDDDIEFLFAPDIDSSGIYQILINGTGNFRDISNGFPQKYLDVVSKARICDGYDKMGATYEDKRWEGELSISLDSLGIDIEKSEVRFLIVRHVCELGSGETSNFVFVDINNAFPSPNTLFEPTRYTYLTFKPSPAVKNTDQKGTKWSIYNPLNNSVTFTLSSDEEFYSGPLENNKDYDDLLPVGLYNYTFSVKSGDLTLFESVIKNQKAEYISTRIENKVLYMDMDFTSIEKQSTVEIFLKKGDKVYYGASFYVKPGKVGKKTLTFDMSKCPDGDYILDFAMGTVYSQTINLSL